MPKATWKGALLAHADAEVQHVEGPLFTHTVCPWKGTCSYYDVRVGDEVNNAFWKGVNVE